MTMHVQKRGKPRNIHVIFFSTFESFPGTRFYLFGDGYNLII